MANIPSSAQYIQIESTRLRSPTSESLFQTMGGTENYLLDQDTATQAALTAQQAEIVALQTQSRPVFVDGNFAIGTGAGSTVLYSKPGGTNWSTAWGGMLGPTTQTLSWVLPGGLAAVGGAKVVSSGVTITLTFGGADLQLSWSGTVGATFYWTACYTT